MGIIRRRHENKGISVCAATRCYVDLQAVILAEVLIVIPGWELGHPFNSCTAVIIPVRCDLGGRY